ncbi:MAG: uroporphyrinogen-III synthase [Acidobacteriota bacterium]
MSLHLENRTILITRSQSQSPEFRHLLEHEGARVLEIPTIEIRPRPSPELDVAIENLGRYQWLMFTSVHGVQIFMERAQELGALSGWPDSIAFPSICSIGPTTAKRVEEYGFRADLVPRIYQAEGILEDFIRLNDGSVKNLRVLLPRASQAREVLPDTLRNRGAMVDVIAVYDTLVPEASRSRLTELLRDESPDLITFTSSSTVANFVTLAPENTNLKQFRYAAIGPITAATAREYGLEIVTQADKSSIPDLVSAIEHYFSHAETPPPE